MNFNFMSFLDKNSVNELFGKSGYTKDDLIEIATDYTNRKKLYDNIEKTVSSKLSSIKNANYIKSRIKSVDSLLLKIIRKKVEKGNTYSIHDYYKKIEDLVGFRVIYLFTEEFNSVHHDLQDLFGSFFKSITANITNDEERLFFERIDSSIRCVINPRRYRSVHYIVEDDSTRIYFEIQARTIFDESWSEIHHALLYPLNLKDSNTGSLAEIFSTVCLFSNDFCNVLKEFSNQYLIHLCEEKNVTTLIRTLKTRIKDSSADLSRQKEMLRLVEQIKKKEARYLDF